MNRSEANILRRLSGGEPIPYNEIPDGVGHLPSGRKGNTERRLVALRTRGLVTGDDGGVWQITAAGAEAAALLPPATARKRNPGEPPAIRPQPRPPAAPAQPLPTQTVPVLRR